MKHEDAAEKIITTEGLAFSLASLDGKHDDLRKARQYLKTAIMRELTVAYESGFADAQKRGDKIGDKLWDTRQHEAYLRGINDYRVGLRNLQPEPAERVE